MIPNRLPRKTAFKLALVRAGLSVTDWAEQHQVSRTHLYLVLEGKRVPSSDLAAKIERTIAGRAA